MSDVSQFVDQVDGVREGVADELATRYESVSELASAREEDLQEVKGVGPVLATRILETARAEAPGTELPPVVVRVATWIGTTVGWTIRACRTLTTPITRLLHRA